MHEETNKENNLDSVSFAIDHSLRSFDLDQDAKKIHIYPNPANHVLNINSYIPMEHYRIVNSSGMEMMSGRLDTTLGSLSLTSLKVGSYFLWVERDGGYKVLKFKIVR